MLRITLHSIYVFSCLVLVSISSASAAECTQPIFSTTHLECYVDKPGYDSWTTDNCFGMIWTSSTLAYFRFENTSIFGDSTSPDFIGWSPNCTSISGSGFTSTCAKTINVYQTLVMSAVVSHVGETCTISAVAMAEGFD